ncbi:MAG TPA: hypothetical protein PK281_09185 [Flavobacteriales bacterium]|nr:hypothetical protein [Flavobacteriales bacterium]
MKLKLIVLLLMGIISSNKIEAQKIDSTLYTALSEVYSLMQVKADKSDSLFVNTVSKFIQQIELTSPTQPIIKTDSLNNSKPKVDNENKQVDSLKNVAFQFSFVPPVSSNGMDNSKCRNQFSVNMLAGYAGAVNGLEIAGFANVLRKEMHGLQLAGFANITAGETEGIQLAGFCNVNQKKVDGIQVSGFSNVVSDSVQGVQIGGFCNVNSGSVSGFQQAGFANINGGKTDGFQCAGFVNSVSDSTTGFQIAGFVNQSSQKMDGVQLAGFMNVAQQELAGVQVSGFINTCRRLKGTQIGFINYADTLESGTPFGFLSVIRKGGFQALEVGASETFPATFQWKTGSDVFYNIFNIGAMPGNNFYWGYGYGFGSNLKKTGKFRINLDLLAMHVNNGEIWTDHVNLLNKAHLGFTWQAAKHFAISGGPTFNVLVVNNPDSELTVQQPTVAPWTVSDKMYNNTRVQMWPGAQLMIRF